MRNKIIKFKFQDRQESCNSTCKAQDVSVKNINEHVQKSSFMGQN